MPFTDVDSSFSEDEYSSSSGSTNSSSQVGNRLDFFSNPKLYGRKAELQKCSDVFDSFCTSDSSSKENGDGSTPFVLVSGLSGVGKSSFVHQFASVLKEKSLQRNCKPFLFLSGKYFNLQSADPYFAIVDAFNGFFLSLMDGDEDDESELQRVLKDIVETIGVTEASLLTSLVPCLARIIRKEVLNTCTDTTVLPDSKEKTWNRLKYILQALLKALCKKSRPLIMFLDDLQWADSSSLDLITAMLTDKSIKYFMFVGAIRPDEVNSDHPLSQRLEDIKETNKIDRIDLSNLSLDEIGEFVADTLKLGIKENKDITNLLYTKTKGNMFFTQQVLEDLFRKKMLYYCRDSYQWRWNTKGVDKIKEDGSSDDVIDVVSSRILSLPKKLQTALIVAAYTRRSIDVDTLQSLMKSRDCIIGTEKLTELLDIAVMERLLSNNVGSTIYSFAHDRIQQVAYTLVEQGRERDELILDIGKRLYEIFSSSTGKHWMLRVAADNMNSSASNDMQPLTMACINLDVAQRMTKIAAFSEASSYLNKGLEKIVQIPNHWDKHYELCFQLYHLLVDIELCLGNCDYGYNLGNYVLGKTKNNTDNITMFRTFSQALRRQERHQQALNMNKKALSLLATCNDNIRFRFARSMVSLLKMKKLFKGLSDEDIIGLPTMKDESKLGAASLLNECAIDSFFCSNSTEFVYSALECVRIAFKHGISSHSSFAFSAFSIVLKLTGDNTAAVRAARLSKKLSDAIPENARKASSIAVTNEFILAYNTPLPDVLESFRQGCKLGLGSGDIYWGFMNWITSNQHTYLSGFHLEEVDRDGVEIVEQMKSYKVYSLLYPFIEFRKVFPYLLGRNKDPLDWKILEEVVHLSILDKKNDSSQTFRLARMCIARLQLGVYFGNFCFADKMADEVLKLQKTNTAYVYVSLKLLFTGIASFFLARDPKTKNRKRKYYVSKARKQYNEMSKCFKSMGRNCHHRYLILKAIVIALNNNNTVKRQRDVQDAYNYAIEAAIRVEHIQDAALCNEVAGEYFLSKNNSDLAIKHFTQAWHGYMSWGAVGKADHLKQNRGSHIDASFKKVFFFKSANHARCTKDEKLLFQTEIQEDKLLFKLPEMVDCDDVSGSRGDVSSFSGDLF